MTPDVPYDEREEVLEMPTFTQIALYTGKRKLPDGDLDRFTEAHLTKFPEAYTEIFWIEDGEGDAEIELQATSPNIAGRGVPQPAKPSSLTLVYDKLTSIDGQRKYGIIKGSSTMNQNLIVPSKGKWKNVVISNGSIDLRFNDAEGLVQLIDDIKNEEGMFTGPIDLEKDRGGEKKMRRKIRSMSNVSSYIKELKGY